MLPTDIFEPESLAVRVVEVVRAALEDDDRISIRTTKSQVAFRGTWMHHLGLADTEELDAEVMGWLRTAADAAC